MVLRKWDGINPITGNDWNQNMGTLEKGFRFIGRNLGLHGHGNGWNSKGYHFLQVYPDKIYRSVLGGCLYELLYTFPDTPSEPRGFFIDSRDYIFWGGWGFAVGDSERIYRSTDGGKTWTQVLSIAGGLSGGIDEDSEGNLYAGSWGANAKIYKSTDGGATWTDISDPSWVNTNHIHSLKVDPETDWLYATIGDVAGYQGCWRSKLKNGADWVLKFADETASFNFIPIFFLDDYV